MFKSFKVLLAGLVLSFGAQAADFQTSLQQTVLALVKFQTAIEARNVIRWKVGDYHKNQVKMALPFPGSGTKTVTKDVPEKNALWYVNEMKILGQNQKTETLLDRKTGKVLELIVNGKKEESTEQDMEILEQYEEDVTVPAGTFQSMYIKAKVRSQGQEQEIEAWINPVDVNLDGMLKVKAKSSMGTVELLLTEFGPK